LLFITCIGGGTAMLHGSHIKVGILADKWTPKTRATVDLFTYPFIMLICFVLVTEGTSMTWDSFVRGSRTDTMFQPLLWPLQSLLALGGFFLGIQVLVEWVKRLVLLTTGETLGSKWVSGEGGFR